MVEKIVFAFVLVAALFVTVIVALNLVVNFCFLGLCYIPLAGGFWVIVILFYKCYLE